jgi:hypothetical protein
LRATKSETMVAKVRGEHGCESPAKRLDSLLDHLADHFEASLDLRRVDEIIGIGKELQHV